MRNPTEKQQDAGIQQLQLESFFGKIENNRDVQENSMLMQEPKYK